MIEGPADAVTTRAVGVVAAAALVGEGDQLLRTPRGNRRRCARRSRASRRLSPGRGPRRCRGRKHSPDGPARPASSLLDHRLRAEARRLSTLAAIARTSVSRSMPPFRMPIDPAVADVAEVRRSRRRSARAATVVPMPRWLGFAAAFSKMASFGALDRDHETAGADAGACRSASRNGVEIVVGEQLLQLRRDRCRRRCGSRPRPRHAHPCRRPRGRGRARARIAYASSLSSRRRPRSDSTSPTTCIRHQCSIMRQVCATRGLDEPPGRRPNSGGLWPDPIARGARDFGGPGRIRPLPARVIPRG